MCIFGKSIIKKYLLEHMCGTVHATSSAPLPPPQTKNMFAMGVRVRSANFVSD